MASPLHAEEEAINPVQSTTPPPTRSHGSRVRRFLYASAGLLLVGVGALGAVLPVLPTAIFLLGASWCFARSCPWLEEKILGSRLFRPLSPWLTGRVSRRARAASLVVMWLAISGSVFLLLNGETPRYLAAAVVVALGLVGTWFIVRWKAKRPRPGEEDGHAPPRLVRPIE